MAGSKIFLIAGENSGDVLAEELIKEFQKTNLTFEGICGPRMRSLGVKTILPMEKLQVMGFVGILLSLPKIIPLFHRVKNHILKTKPDAVIFIDYPGFNLRMAKALRKHGYKGKLIHYVCPSVWAWGKKRIQTMIDHLDLLLSILPFEKKLFEHSSLPVEYIGHPLIQKIQDHCYEKNWNLPTEKKILSIFPGSRKSEIHQNFALQFQVAKKVAREHDLTIAISVAHENLRAEIDPIIQDEKVYIVDSLKRYELMKQTYIAIATSGTVTLELALHNVPTAITYGLKKFDQFLAQRIYHIDLPYYTLPNIVLSKEVFAELIGPYFTSESLKKCLLNLLEENRRKDCMENCKKIRLTLKDTMASKEAAQKILQIC